MDEVRPSNFDAAINSYLGVIADEFIAEPEGEGDDEEGPRRSVHHARLDRQDRELNDQDLARIAEDVSQRYKRAAVRYTGDMNEVPQRLLMPSVQDANLWQVRCKVGFRSGRWVHEC
jgi:transcription elongation factor SPT5